MMYDWFLGVVALLKPLDWQWYKIRCGLGEMVGAASKDALVILIMQIKTTQNFIFRYVAQLSQGCDSFYLGRSVFYQSENGKYNLISV